MSGFLQEEALRQQRLEQMAREDQQVIQRFNHSPAPFQRDKKKSLARQYRDYLIYRHVDHPEEEAYGPRQEAAGYIQFQISQSRAAHQGQDPTLEGSALKTGHCLLHLAASQLLAKEVGNDTLTRLADCLTAGSAWSAEDQQDPSQAYYQTLRQQGNALLKEIYFRHLEAMDRQYGEKLCSMTPAAYLEALPQIEADFACIEDMQIYFQQVAPLSGEEALMGKKLDFYVQVWARLKERTQILSDMQGEHVTQKGTLSGQYDAAYRREMQALRSAARRDKRLRPRKERPPLPQTTSLDQVRSQALAALAQQQMIEQEEQQKDDAIAQQFEQLTGQQARLQAYLTACAILKQDNASPDAVQMAQATLQRFPGYTEARAEQEIADLAGPINALSEQRGQGQEAPIDSPELLLERCAQTTQIMQELARQMREYSDAELPGQYVDMVSKFNLASNRYQVIRNHPIYHAAVEAREAAKDGDDQALTPQQQEILAAVEQLTHTESLLRSFSPVLNARMSALARCGVAHRQDNQQREDLYLQHKEILSSYQSYQDEPIPLADALEGPLPSPMSLHLNNPDPVNYTALRRQLDRMKAVEQFRREHPDYYRLGLSERDYRKAQQMCDMLPHCQRLLELTLRYYHISDRGGLTAQAIRQEFDQQVTLLQNVTRQWGARSQNIRDDLARDLNGLSLGIQQAQQAIQSDESLQGDQSLSIDLEMMDQLQGGVFLSTVDHQTALRDFAKVRLTQQWMKVNEDGQQEDGPLSEEEQQAAAELLQRFSDQYDRTLTPLINGGCGDRALFEAHTDLEACAAMGTFLNYIFQTPKGARLLALWSQDEHFAPMHLQVTKLQAHFKTISNLTGYATSLALTRAMKNGVSSCIFQYNGRPIHAADTSHMRDMIHVLRQENLGGVEQLRIEGMQQLHREEIEEIEMKKRVRMGVGRELEASRRKGKMVNVSSFMEWCGNRMGGIMQLLSWSVRQKRTMQHGAVLYEQSKAKQDELLNLVPTMGDGHLPQQWQRGSTGIAPPIQLDALYHDPMKADLLQDLRQSRAGIFAQQDPQAMNGQALDLALEALERWCQVNGIVNTDVTEMEMSFLDVFLTNAKEYIQSNESSTSPVLHGQCEKLQEILHTLGERLRGTMADAMSQEELERIAANTTAYVEDTTFSANLDESNIKDIPLFLHTPSINDVRQSSIGDCWLLSAISSVVRTDPDFIRSMFHDLGDGNVLVRLYAAVDANGKTITDKDALLESGVTMIPCWFQLRKQYETGWGNAADCTWVQLLEKAYALGGFNLQNEVEVREGRLYNVANELTMGAIWGALPI